MLEFYVALVLQLGVGVYAYEYTGYGAATGDAAHESQVMMDATAGWEKLTSPADAGGYGEHTPALPTTATRLPATSLRECFALMFYRRHAIAHHHLWAVHRLWAVHIPRVHARARWLRGR